MDVYFSFKEHNPIFMTVNVLQVFVDRQCVGCLDYKTQELALPDGKVLPVFLALSAAI